MKEENDNSCRQGLADKIGNIRQFVDVLGAFPLLSRHKVLPQHLPDFHKLIFSVKTLIDAGAHVNLCDLEIVGTPLYVLCFRQKDSPEEEEEVKQMIQLLLDKGAKVNKKGGKCRYRLYSACLRRVPTQSSS